MPYIGCKVSWKQRSTEELPGRIELASSFQNGYVVAVLVWSILCLVPRSRAQNPSTLSRDVMVVPDITVQTEDYAESRKTFHTKLLQQGPAPHQDCKNSKPPLGAAEVYFPSGGLRLRAWVGIPATEDKQKHPAVLFLHGGFCFDASDWEDAKAFRDAGFIVMLPNRRGENGQPGNFTMFYDEVEDVINAAEYLRKEAFVDDRKLYVAGSSTGGTLTMLAALTYPHFRAAASFSGSPDDVGYTRHAVAVGNWSDIPFDYRNTEELQLRSARVYAASFKRPARLYYGTEEKHFALSTQPTADLARQHGLDVRAIAVEGGHNSAEAAEIGMAIKFFHETK